MTPKFWLIIDLVDGSFLVDNFETKEELNDFLRSFPNPEDIKSLEVVSGFSITKRGK